MRIIHFSKYYHPALGGLETHVRTLAQGQAKLGAEVHVVAINHLDQLDQDLGNKSLGRTYSKEVNDGPVKVHLVGRILNIARFDVPLGLTQCLQRLNRLKPDILHLHAPNATITVAMTLCRIDGTLVITHHSDVLKQGLLYVPFSRFEEKIYSKAKTLISDSEQYVNGSRLLSKHSNKTCVLPLGIDLSDYLSPSSATRNWKEIFLNQHGPLLWLIAGRLCHYKGIRIALEALRDVPGKLLIAGTGPLENELKRLAFKYGVSERVVWLGKVGKDELIGAYLAATALWFPSNARNEGFGQVQVESMACGTPVINCEIPDSGVPWVSINDLTGLTVPMNSSKALASAANSLHESAALRTRLSIAAQARAKEIFGDRKMAESSLRIYEQSLAGQRHLDSGNRH